LLLSILDNFAQHKEIDDSTGININSKCLSLYGKASRNIHAIQVAMGDIRIEETLPGQPAGESHLAFSGVSDPLAHQIEVIRERIYHEDSPLGVLLHLGKSPI
jgi:hypothetical protein